MQSKTRQASCGDIGLFVETHSLTKRYRRFTALDACSLGVEVGEVFGLLGPNGAGKTTLLRLLLGYLQPTSGRATIGGLDCQRQSVAARQLVSYLPGEARLYRGMRGRDVLRFLAEVRPGGDFRQALRFAERLDLELARRVAFMSTGMRQKLAFAATMSSDSPLVILDEPTANLDPSVRATVSEMIVEAKAAGRTVMFSSHVLSEVEEVCDRVAILRAGQCVHTQVIAELRRRHRLAASFVGEVPTVPDELADSLRISRGGHGELIIEADELSSSLRWLATLPVTEIRAEPIGLRSVYDKYHVNRDATA
ncbi:MAG TPA: ABC transporter ATP-binding protein [Pirellulaceae bacterium]|nr:ABC transporter ATP-binding protein [Pirellulaceae bacterium]